MQTSVYRHFNLLEGCHAGDLEMVLGRAACEPWEGEGYVCASPCVEEGDQKGRSLLSASASDSP